MHYNAENTAAKQHNSIKYSYVTKPAKIGHIHKQKLSYFVTVAYPYFSSDKDVLLKVYAMLIN